jgi:hypothetical protein
MLRMCLGAAPDFVATAVTMRCVVHPEALESPLALIEEIGVRFV